VVRCVARRVAAAALTASVVLVARDGHAYHEGDQRIVDGTAYTLKRGTFDLGLFKQMWGPWDRLTLGTYLVPWVLRFANLDLKWRFYGGDPLSLSARIGFTRFVPKDVASGAGSAELGIVPFELLGSWRFDDRWTLSAGALYTVVTLKGSYDPAKLEGLAAVTNLQVLANLEYRLTRVTAFVLAGRYLAFQNAGGRASATLTPDAYTTIELESVANTSALDFPHAFSIVPSVVFSWKTFNLRLGLGYGNYSVPMVNLVLPNKTVVPDFDLYWVF
jgi:hypothetical protein